MPINVRVDGDVVILSNIGRLMNDPRYVDAGRDVKELLDQGHCLFILELAGVRETGTTVIGLLTTLTRQVRQRGGELVLAKVGPALEEFIEAMRMDTYWDLFASVDEAKEYLLRSRGIGRGD